MASLTDALKLRGDRQGTALVIVLTWGCVVLPALVQSFTAPKSRQLTSDVEVSSTLANLTTLLLTLGLTFLLLLLLVRHLRDMPTDRRGVLVVLILPWAYQVSRDMYAGTSLRLGGLLYPLLVTVIWMLRPSLRQLSLLGYLVGATGLISVLMGALDPVKGILQNTGGQIITPDKQILPWGILIGPLTDGNPLGQFLALGTPAIVFIRQWWLRYPLLAVTAFGVLWTSNRGSLASLFVGLIVAGLLRLTPYGARRPVAVTVLAAMSALVAYLPLTTTSNDAFTNRGYIWQASLRNWETHPFIGLGSQWYSQSARYANNIGPTAFHGHNTFVQFVVLGGLINLALMVLMLVVVYRLAGRWAELYDTKFPTAFLAMLLTSATLEVALSIVHRSFLLPVTVIPIAYICFAREDRPIAADADRAPELPEFARPGSSRAGAAGRAGAEHEPEPETTAIPSADAETLTVPLVLGAGSPFDGIDELRAPAIPTSATTAAGRTSGVPRLVDPDAPPPTARLNLGTSALRRITGAPDVPRVGAGDQEDAAEDRPEPAAQPDGADGPNETDGTDIADGPDTADGPAGDVTRTEPPRGPGPRPGPGN